MPANVTERIYSDCYKHGHALHDHYTVYQCFNLLTLLHYITQQHTECHHTWINKK